MTTIRDVAQTAGVSIGTVSACINASAPVSEALRRRVDAAIESTGYRPDALARSLKTGITRTLGLAVSGLASPFTAVLARSAAEAAASQNYALLLADAGSDAETEGSRLRFLAARRVDGAILLPSAAGAGDVARWRGCLEAPLLVIGTAPKDCPYDCIAVDYTPAAEAAVDHLAALGHRRIALAIGPALVAHGEDCLAGYRRGLERQGMGFQPRLVRVAGAKPNQAQETARALLTAADRATAIIACGGTLALSMLGVAASLGIACPSDISILSLGDGDWTTASLPAITAIAEPAEKVGTTAVRLMLERLQGGGALQPRRVFVPAALIARASTAAPGARP